MEIENVYQDGANFALIKGMGNEYYIRVNGNIVNRFVAISEMEAKGRFQSFVRASL